jgi:hypothetical protein
MFMTLQYAFNAATGTPPASWEEERYRFFRALKKDDADAVRATAAKYPDCIAWSTPKGSALAVAQKNGSLESFRALIALGANVDEDNKHGSLLHLAVKKRQTAFVTALLDNKADMGKRSHRLIHGRFPLVQEATPLAVAIAGRDKEMVRLLVGAGASLNAPCFRQKFLMSLGPLSPLTPAQYAAGSKLNEMADYMAMLAKAPAPAPAPGSPAAPAPLVLQAPVKVGGPLRIRQKQQTP